MERKTGRSKDQKKDGQKWVEGNYDAKMKAKEENDGVMPYTPALKTSDHPMSREWSSENLPETLFYLTPPESRFAGQSVQFLRDEETGKIALSEEGNKVKDFEILPRYISVEVEGWMIEAWRRIDSRITYQDILDRQRSDPTFGGIGLKKLSKNALQNHCYRDCRKLLNSWVEYGRRGEPHRTEVETIEGLSYDQVVYNTVLKESPTFKGRLVKIAFRRRPKDGLFRATPMEVTSANVRQTTFDLLQFMDAAPEPKQSSPDNYMTPCMDAAWEMSLILSERARMHDKQNWSKLDRQCLPVTWGDRLAKSKKTVSNSTYDGGCAICSWTEGRDEGFTFDQEKEDHLFTPRKRIRSPSESNSDEPLSRKRKRNKFVMNYNLDSETESEDEIIIKDGSPQTRDGSSPSSSLVFATPVHSRSAYASDEDYDIEVVGDDENATESLSSSETQALSSSVGPPDAHHQHLLYPTGIFNSPLAKFSNPSYYDLNGDYHPTGIRPAATVFPQPQWDKLGVTSSASNGPSEMPRPGTNYYLDFAQDWAGRGDVSFTSTYIDSSLSSQDYSSGTIASSFTADFSMSDVQAANARMQNIVAYDPQAEFLDQAPPHHPGRMTTQGNNLTDAFSSPPERLSSEFEITPHTYHSDVSTLESSFLRRHSFGGYLPANLVLTPYGNDPDLEWEDGDSEHADTNSAPQDAISQNDYNQLPLAPTLSTPPGRDNMSFMDLLSSDPVMPEHHLNLLDPGFSTGKYPQHNFRESNFVEYENPIDQGISRNGRQTPPLLEC